MTTPTIHITPSSRSEPRRTYSPVECAFRWCSPFEENELIPAVSVFVSQKAFIRFCAHAGSDLENEVGGWLVGKWCEDKKTKRQFVVVESILSAPHVRHGGTFLTFTQDTQVELYSQLMQRYPGRELVGWYHTHPKMSVFFSSYDAWLHENFFPQIHQVALVIEPYTAAGGFFIRQLDGTLDTRRYFGFYELHNRSNRSVVHWRNVFPDQEIQQEDSEE